MSAQTIQSTNGTVYGDPIQHADKTHVQAQVRRRVGTANGTVILQGGWSKTDVADDNGWVDLDTISASTNRLTAGVLKDATYPYYRFKVTSTGVSTFECRTFAQRR